MFKKKLLERGNLIWRWCDWLNLVLLWNLIQLSKSEWDTQRVLPFPLCRHCHETQTQLSCSMFCPSQSISRTLIFYKCHAAIKSLWVSWFSLGTNFYGTGRGIEVCNILDLSKICFSSILTICLKPDGM